MITYEKMSPNEWEQLAPKKAARAKSEWEPVLDELQRGEIVRIPFTTDKERKSRRIALARLASGRGFKTDVRYGEDYFAVKKSATPRAPGRPRTRARSKE